MTPEFENYQNYFTFLPWDTSATGISVDSPGFKRIEQLANESKNIFDALEDMCSLTTDEQILILTEFFWHGNTQLTNNLIQKLTEINPSEEYRNQLLTPFNNYKERLLENNIEYPLLDSSGLSLESRIAA